MLAYTFPRDVFDLLVDTFGEREKADKFAKAMEAIITTIDEKANNAIVEKKEITKIELKEELRNELVTREIFEEKFNFLEKEILLTREIFEEKFNFLEKEILLTREIFEKETLLTREIFGEKFNSLSLLLKIFIALATVALTFANPTFTKLIEKVFKL